MAAIGESLVYSRAIETTLQTRLRRDGGSHLWGLRLLSNRGGRYRRELRLRRRAERRASMSDRTSSWRWWITAQWRAWWTGP